MTTVNIDTATKDLLDESKKHLGNIYAEAGTPVTEITFNMVINHIAKKFLKEYSL